MVPAIPLAVKLAALFEAAIGLHGGIVGRIVLRLASQLVLRELDGINSWAIKLTSPERFHDGVAELKTWLRERLRLPKWMRPFVRCNCRITKICDWMLENKEELLAEARKVAIQQAGATLAR